MSTALHVDPSGATPPPPGMREAVVRAGRRRRRRAVLGTGAVGGGLVALALLAVTSAVSGPDRLRVEEPAASGTAAPTTRQDPLGLVGYWRVEAEGEPAGTVLELARDIAVHSPCGRRFGTWRATGGGLFVSTVYAGDSACRPTPAPPAWLDKARRFRADGDDRLLLDAAGSTLARLSPSPAPEGSPTGAGLVTSELRATLRDAAPLPAGVDPATEESLQGQWIPQTPDPRQHGGHGRAFVEFRGDGGWTGSDGCNGRGGAYAIGAGGEFVAVSGASTLIGCANSPAPQWVAEASSAGFDGDALVLFGADGEQLGRFTRGVPVS